jgi:hypothetical protein
MEVQRHAFLTSELDGGEWPTSLPGRFTPRESAPGTHWIGGWVGPRAVLDTVVKIKILSPRRESNPRTPIFQPAAQGNDAMYFCGKDTNFSEDFVTSIFKTTRRHNSEDLDWLS